MNYNKELIDLLSSLTPIQPQLIMKKNEDCNISLKANDDKVTICYTLDAPKSYFEFPGEEIAWFDFKKFNECFNVYNKPNKDEKLADTPVLDVNTNEAGNVTDLIIKSSKYNSKINHRMARPDVLAKPVFNNIVLPSVDAAFSLSEEEFASLTKMIGIIVADTVKFSFNGNECIVTLSNTKTSNTYDIAYTLSTPATTNFDLVIPTTGLSKIVGGTYDVSVCARGLLKWHMVRDDEIDLNMYISKKGN